MSGKRIKSKVEDLLFRIAQCYANTGDPVIESLAEEAYQRGELWLLTVENGIDGERAYNAFIDSYLTLVEYDETH